MEVTAEKTGLEVLDLRTDATFAARSLHPRDIEIQMTGLQRLSRVLLEQPETILQELVRAAVDLWCSFLWQTEILILRVYKESLCFNAATVTNRKENNLCLSSAMSSNGLIRSLQR